MHPPQRSPLAIQPGIEHEFLGRYAALFASGAAAGYPYVDGFAGGRPGVAAPTAAAAGVAARWADAGAGRGVAVLLDEDPARVERLAQALRAGTPAVRAEVVDRLEDVAAGDVRLAAMAWAQALAPILATIDAAGGALVWLDVPAPEAVPAADAAALLRAGADVLLRVPTESFRRLSGWPNVPLADLPPHVRRAVEGCSTMLGDARHGWAGEWRAAEAARGVDAAERGAVAALRARYAAAAEGTIVRAIELAPTSAASATQLLLATPCPLRALEVDRVLHRMRQQRLLRWPEAAADDATTAALVRYTPRAELELFDAGEPVLVREVDRTLLRAELLRRFAGRRATLGEVMRALVGTGLFPEELRQALSALRREGWLGYRSLGTPAEPLDFAEEARPPATRRAARSRGAAAGQLFAADE